jgi:hypothetical protein
MMEGWYYLHVNGDLIYKREIGDTAANIRESDFARALWPCDPADREGAWRICIEALAAGADKLRVLDLAARWHCDDQDADVYAERVGINLFRDGNAWCATAGDFLDLQQSEAGFGVSKLEAFAELAIALGYEPSKMWGATFADLLNAHRQVAQDG